MKKSPIRWTRKRLSHGWLTVSGALLVTLAPAMPLAAANSTGAFNVGAVIASACAVTATPLNFGVYDPTNATALNGSSTVSVFCTSGTAYTTSLDVGTGGGTYSARTVANGSNTLSYNLFRDASHSQVWGDGSGTTYTVTGSGNGLLTGNTITVYGQVGSSQDRQAGVYSSTITVTIAY